MDGLLASLSTHGLAGLVIGMLMLAVAWLGRTLLAALTARAADVEKLSTVIAESTAARRELTAAFTELAALVRQSVELQRIRDEVDRREARQ